jgi:large subunit ribosomal protein L24
MPARVKTGDEVIVISGKDRGRRGKILSVDPTRGRVVVEGINMIKRHQRPRQTGTTAQQTGGVIEREGSVHASNVMPIDPKDGKPTRVGTVLVDGKRLRVAKRSGTRLD